MESQVPNWCEFSYLRQGEKWHREWICVRVAYEVVSSEVGSEREESCPRALVAEKVYTMNFLGCENVGGIICLFVCLL